MEGVFSPYSDDLSEGDNEHLPQDHPRRFKLPASHLFVSGDLIPEQSPIRQLYGNPVFQTFVAAILREKAVFSVDEMAGVNYLIYEPGDCNGNNQCAQQQQVSFVAVSFLVLWIDGGK